MSAASKPARRGRPTGRAVLTPQDWFDAATEAILDGGFDQLRVLPLAKRLKVTRGSFYWHFEDLPQFIRLFSINGKPCASRACATGSRVWTRRLRRNRKWIACYC
ncbi:TetR/AcrR family transcriptional regulator [Halopseudomonas pachastrellae]|nr:TetR/AcrR family transcriptional regulator [Halopseudomonas pachastrellae]